MNQRLYSAEQTAPLATSTKMMLKGPLAMALSAVGGQGPSAVGTRPVGRVGPAGLGLTGFNDLSGPTID